MWWSNSMPLGCSQMGVGSSTSERLEKLKSQDDAPSAGIYFVQR
jgi:hypothetical protein